VFFTPKLQFLKKVCNLGVKSAILPVYRLPFTGKSVVKNLPFTGKSVPVNYRYTNTSDTNKQTNKHRCSINSGIYSARGLVKFAKQQATKMTCDKIGKCFCDTHPDKNSNLLKRWLKRST
jgi:hypothetical protein